MSEPYVQSPAMVKNRPILFVLCLLLIPFFGLGLAILVIWYLQCKATVVRVSDGEIMLEKGLLSKDRTELKLSNIRSTKLVQSFGQRIFGTGDVQVFTAGDSPELVASGMPKPQELRQLLKGG
ncbi:PH domain-containing protein [Congregibacter variabilis]|uniref:PH domain-containing protein n=1 Tax=Congregibacter variabilis TaxID=3081200 RepID=A0ABZ0I2H3_9GAMM|nr:PH domain-containing protein [Congregibacter sp. IMCC43200]